MYPLVLMVHGLLRWVVIGLGLLVLARAARGTFGAQTWTRGDDRAGLFFIIALDLQALLGLALYGVLSPITSVAFADLRAAMADATLRFWAVEHISVMMVALVLAHIGRARARTVTSPVRKHRTMLIFIALALIAIALAVPWPWLEPGKARPLIATW